MAIAFKPTTEPALAVDRPRKADPKPVVVNTPVNCKPDTNAVNTPAVNKVDAVNTHGPRGAYPNTDDRRAYMRAYMARRRAKSPNN